MVDGGAGAGAARRGGNASWNKGTDVDDRVSYCGFRWLQGGFNRMRQKSDESDGNNKGLFWRPLQSQGRLRTGGIGMKTADGEERWK